MGEESVVEFLMGLQDVALSPSWASLSTTFIKNSSSAESFGMTTYPKILVGGNQGHAPCKILLLQKSLFRVSHIS